MILVVGGTGRLGSLVVADLVKQGERVRVLSRHAARAAHLKGVEVVTGDVRDAAAVDSAVRGATTVLSAIHGFVGPRGVSPATVDRDGNANLVAAAAHSGADVVLMSIVGAAPDHPDELFRMKYAAETGLRAASVRSAVVRATAFAELWIELMRQTASRGGRPLVFGSGANPINFVSVVDVAALVERVLTDSSTRGETIEIGGPDNVTLTDLARRVQAADGRDGEPRKIPRPALHLMANTVGRFRPQLGRQARAALAMDSGNYAFDATATRSRFPGLPCTSLEELLR